MPKLRDYAEVRLGLKGVQHQDDVLMAQVAQYLNLLAQVADIFLALAVLHDELHGCDLACVLAAPLVDLHSMSAWKAWKLSTASL